MPQFSKFIHEYSGAKNRNRLTNSKLPQNELNSTLGTFSDLIKLNNMKKKRMRNFERIKGPDTPN